jgi:4-amino-4-deoxy-L-arabinose transferase-like glycosyltransferase
VVPPLPGDEARFAQATREMLARGDWVVPTVGGVPRYDKPILIYWLLAASQTALGDTPLAYRLPSILAAAVTVGLVAWWARRRWGPGAGLTAGGLLAATFMVQVEARAATADAVLLLPTTVALLALQRLSRGAVERRAQLALWLGLSLAVLAKGPVGPAVAAAAALAAWGLGRTWRPWEAWALGLVLVAGWAWLGPIALAVPAAYALALAARDPETRRGFARLGAVWGLPLAAAGVALWAVPAYLATDGAFFHAAVGHHVVARSLTALEGHGGVPGFYLLTGALAAFPWFLLLGPALRERLPSVRADAESRFLVAWLLGPLILVELSETKLVHYWLPAYPAGVLLVTAWLCGTGGRSLSDRALGAVAGRVTVIAGLALAGAPVIAAAGFGLDDVVRPALVAALALALGLLAFTRAAGSRLPVGAAALGLGAALHGAILAGACLPRLSDAVVERRAARAVLAARAPGDALVLYRGRPADALVTLPLGTTACATAACVAELAARGGVTGVAPARDLAELRRRAPALRVEWITAVSGLDLVHGRWEGWIVFRAERQSEAVS